MKRRGKEARMGETGPVEESDENSDAQRPWSAHR